MRANWSAEQEQNEDSPRIEALELASNVKADRLRQELKHDLGIDPTDEGMQIDWSEKHSQNADFPSVES
jgi:hypothetical protein